MTHWICVTCGTQFSASEQQPQICPICTDERQYIGYKGQQWTTLAKMREDGFHTVFREEEPGLMGIGTEPSFAIGQRALLLQTSEGNILWDCITYLDDETVEKVQQLGGIKMIAISHPHYYSCMIEWAERFQAPIYLHEAERNWVMRPSEHVQFWSAETMPLPGGATLIRLGGHFPGGQVLHWPHTADGKGIVLAGDIMTVVADRNWVSFMYSYPNLIPLPESDIARIRDTIAFYTFDRLYAAWFDRVVSSDAHDAVLRSANRYLRALERNLG